MIIFVIGIVFSYDCYKSRLPGNQAVSLGYPVSFSSSYMDSINHIGLMLRVSIMLGVLNILIIINIFKFLLVSLNIGQE